jgi:transcriptional regulator with XRE-family HTH domain
VSDHPSEEDEWLRRERQRVGRCIRHAREDRGLTQERVFHAIPMNRSHYQQIESGEANPTLDMLLRIARAIGVAISDLLHD